MPDDPTHHSLEPSVLGAFLDALTGADESAAMAITDDVRGSDPGGVDVVVDVLVPAGLQRVGDMWATGRLTVAQEHIATDICDRIVTKLTSELAARSPESPVVGTVLVANAEGEWHHLAGRVVRACFIKDWWHATQLGPSVSAAQLATAIHDQGPDVVALTCSMPANLGGARRMIVAAHDAGVPVIVGGTAFGTAEIARRLRADGWAPAASAAPAEASRIVGEVVVPDDGHAADEPEEAQLIAVQAREIVARMGERLDREWQGDSRLVTASVWLLRALESALVCDEPGILVDQVRWQAQRAGVANDVAPEVAVSAIADALPERAFEARRLLRESLAALDGRV